MICEHQAPKNLRPVRYVAVLFGWKVCLPSQAVWLGDRRKSSRQNLPPAVHSVPIVLS